MNVVLQCGQTYQATFVSADELVKGVSITGFEIQGFSGANIAVVGAIGTKLIKNKLVNGPKFGIIALGSTKSEVTNNKVRFTLPGAPQGSSLYGIGVTDAPGAKATYVQDHLWI